VPRCTAKVVVGVKELFLLFLNNFDYHVKFVIGNLLSFFTIKIFMNKNKN